VRDEKLRCSLIIQQCCFLVALVKPVDQLARYRDINFGFSDDLGDGVVGWVEAGYFELLFDFVLQLAHLVFLAVDQDYILWFQVREQLHDALRICMRTEAHVVDLHLDVHDFIINRDLLLAAEDFVTDSAWHAVAWDDNRVFLKRSPFFKCLQAQAAMEHTRGCEEDHRFVYLEHGLVELADVAEVEHVLFNESLLDFFVGPVDEELVVEVRLLG